MRAGQASPSALGAQAAGPRLQTACRLRVLPRICAQAVRAATAAELPAPTAEAKALGPSRVPRSRPRRSPKVQKEDTWSLEDVAVHGWKRDEAREAGRRHMQELSSFTFQRWAFHRGGSRYLRHMAGIFQSRIVRNLAQPVLFAGSAALAVATYETLLQDGVLPASLPSFLLPTLPFDITSFALSLLLVFRTNTSYDRWLQGLKSWTDISIRSRDTLRQLLAYCAAPAAEGGAAGADADAVQAASAAAKWMVAFARSLKAQVTEDSDLPRELKGVLTAEECKLLLAASHRPSFALAVLSQLVAAAPVRDSQRIRLDENLTFFEGCVGTCERILRTPIPLSYTRHTSRFMVIWLACLPLGLFSACGWGTPLLTVVISFLLLGIEEIGVAIEEPFSILPLEDLCRELEFALADMLEQAAPSKQAADAAVAAAAVAAAAAAAAPARGRRSAGGTRARRSAGAASQAAAATSSAGTSTTAGAVNAVAPFLPASPGTRGLLGRHRPAPTAPDARSVDAIFRSLDDV